MKIRVISTPWGPSGVYAQIWHKGEGWSRHRVDVHDAIADGFPVDFEALKRDYTSDQLAQEFLCSFDAGSSSYIPPALIKSSLQLQLGGTPERRFLGVDVGSVDLSALVWICETSEGVIVEDVQTFEGLSSLELEDLVSEVLENDPTLDRCIVDATGVGAGVGAHLRARHPGRVVAQQISHGWKVSHTVSLKMGLERDLIQLCDHPILRSDLGRLERKVSAANRVIFSVKRRAGLGHGDALSALTLAWSLTKLTRQLQRPQTGSQTPIKQIDLPSPFGSGFGYLTDF